MLRPFKISSKEIPNIVSAASIAVSIIGAISAAYVSYQTLYINADLKNLLMEKEIFLACVGDGLEGCRHRSLSKFEITARNFACGSDVSEIQKNLCFANHSEAQLIQSKAGGKCGYTELLIDCRK